jgi:hypothetical protein
MAVETYLSQCPQCTIDSKKNKKTKLCPLKFMTSNSCGTRAQVDLIDMRSSENPVTGHKCILHYGDHLSGYSQVWCLTSKSSKKFGEALAQILSSSLLPKVLQSDNGGEFLGK